MVFVYFINFRKFIAPQNTNLCVFTINCRIALSLDCGLATFIEEVNYLYVGVNCAEVPSI
jgi:hypothetical protein